MKIFRMLGIAATTMFVASTLTPIWNVLGTSLAVSASIAPAQAIIVLAAGVPDGPMLNDESLRRAIHGIELYKKGFAPLLVLSGSSDSEGPDESEAAIRKAMAVALGVPPNRITTIVDVSTTRDEAQKTAGIIVPGGGTILLVTNSLHMRRAMGVFERAGLKVLPAPSDDWPNNTEGVEGRIILLRDVLEQTGGLIYYKLFGYI